MTGRKGQWQALVGITIVLFVIGLLPTILTAVGLAYGVDVQEFLGTITGLDQSLLTFPTYLWYLILPYVATVAIIMGLFEKMGIFSGVKNPEAYYLVIALGWVGVLIPTGALQWITGILYGAGTIWGIAMFMITFFAGSFIIARAGWSRAKTFGTETKAMEATMKAKEKQIERYVDDLKKYDPSNKKHKGQITKLERKIAELRNEIEGEKRKMQRLAGLGV